MLVTKHMIHGSGQTENASYHNVCPDPDSGLCYLMKVADYEKLEPVEAIDAKVCTLVADIWQRQCTNTSIMEQEP